MASSLEKTAREERPGVEILPMDFHEFVDLVLSRMPETTHVYATGSFIHASVGRRQYLVGCTAGVSWPFEAGRVFHVSNGMLTGRLNKYMPHGAETYCGKYLRDVYPQAVQDAQLANMLAENEKNSREVRRARWKQPPSRIPRK